MEKKKKYHKLASTHCQEVNETNDLLSKEDQNQSGAAKISKNQQFQPIFQWPNITQSDVEQSPLISNPCIPTNQSPSPIIPIQWQHSQHPRPNPIVQYAQPHTQLAQSGMPFWQGPGITNGEISAKIQTQTPSFSYHVGYPYPGPWDPSSWWCQQQQSVPPSTYSFPGACGYFSSLLPPMPSSLAASASFHRGIIQPPPKLSQKHLKLWEAQSAENVQLWNIVDHLQSELTDYKNRLTKLEAEVSSIKPTVEEPPSRGTGACSAGQTSKRGRPKRPIASNDVLPLAHKPRPRARGRKPQSETEELNFEKENQKQVGDKANSKNIFTHTSESVGITVSNPLVFHNQIHQDIPGVQIPGVCLKNSSELQSDDNKFGGGSKTNFSISSHHVKGIETKTASANYEGLTGNGNFGWPSNISTVDCGRDLINVNSQSFYSDGRKVVPEWSFENVESGKDEDEEIEDDGSSGC